MTPRGNRFIDLTGHRYGRLAVTALAHRSGKHTHWWCACDCGETMKCTSNSLRTGNTTSCGCVKRALRTNLRHGMSKTPTYCTWLSMRTRCTDPTRDAYPYYGGRGISVCERWMSSFDAFLADMGERPEGMTIERRNHEGNYEPGNCRWATKVEQARNTSATRIVSVDGVDMSLAEACERSGAAYQLVYTRLRRGWSVERALGASS